MTTANKLLVVLSALAAFATHAGTLPQPAQATASFDALHESPEAYNARAQWLRDAKLGVFLHWTPSVLCGGEVSWIMRQNMGDMPKVSKDIYMNLPKQFNPKNFDAKQWVKLFEEAGIRYAVIVPKHHDGFAMWDTKVDPGIPDWTIMKTPWRRDYVKEVAEACNGSKVQFCLYYSVLDWVNPRYKSNAGADLTAYKNEVFKPHMKELLTRYGKVGCVWFDGHWEASWTHADGKEMYAYMRRLQPGTLFGNRIDQKAKSSKACSWTGSFFDAPDAVGDYQAREMDVGNFYMDKAWDNCYNLRANPCGSWSWVKDQYNWPVRTRDDVIGKLIECIGRDGGLLLGLGPREDGTIDREDASALRTIGVWMKENAEAVYGTRGGPWTPGPWGVSTRKARKVFLFVQQLQDGKLTLPALPAKVLSARMLQGAPVELTTNDGIMTISIPRGRRNLSPAAIVELTLDQDALKLSPISSSASAVNNYALGRPVEVSSVWAGRDTTDLKPAFITDGEESTTWAAAESARSATVTVDLGKECTVRKIIFSDAPYRRTRAFDIEALVGDKWQKIGDGTETNFSGNAEIKVADLKARKIRVNIRQASDTPVVSEIQVLGK